MDEFILNPHIPTKKVTLAAVSNKYSIIIQQLEKLHIHVLPVCPNKKLAYPVQSHADMLFCVLKGKRVLVANNSQKLFDDLQNNGFIVTKTGQNLMTTYPKDVLLNAILLKNYFIGNIKFVDTMLQQWVTQQKLHIIHVPQGYTKCSVAILNHHAVITTDIAIAKQLALYKFDVLWIDPRDILLEGYDYGFIGGCCGLIDKQTIAFTGTIKKHRDYDKITAFLKKHHIESVYLTNGRLIDVGGIIPLKQEK